MSLNINDLAQEIAKGLSEYSEKVVVEVKKAIDEETDEGLKAIKSASPILTGDYAKGWKSGKVYETKKTKKNRIFNETDYQLTHLLENGHVGRDGKRVAPVPHLKETDQAIQKNLILKVEGAIQG